VGQEIDTRRRSLANRFDVWRPLTLDRRLDESAAEFGRRPFVITDERSITYTEAADWSRRLADGLIALGVKPGNRVALLMANYMEFVPLKFAIARAGAVAVSFSYFYRTEELAYVLAQSECHVLISMTGFLDLDYLDMLDQIAPSWDSPSDVVSSDGVDAVVVPSPRKIATLPHLRQVILLSTDGRTREHVLSVEALAALGDLHEGLSSELGRAPEDASDIMYTSGTTGFPKGVLVSHDAVQRTAFASALTRAYEDGRRILFSLPSYHMFGYVEGLLSVMFVGGAVILQTSFNPVECLRGIEEHGATDLLCVPTMAVALLECDERDTYSLDSLQAILCGSAPAPVWLWEKVQEKFGVNEIVTGYGMTECGGAMTLTLPEDELELTSTTVGRPKLAGSAGIHGAGGDLVRYKTIDPMTGESLAGGQIGELVSTGPTSMLGFWKNDKETRAASPDGWLRSGDLGRVRSDGYIEVTGRSKELYKSGGELVMPKEIEDLLTAHDDISQAYAVGVVDDRWGDIGCAVVVPRPGSQITTDDVLTLCRESLARFKVPKKVLFLEAGELPTTATGKVQKFMLVELARQLLDTNA
jgi:fatty-acyl-CoA synthase